MRTPTSLLIRHIGTAMLASGATGMHTEMCMDIQYIVVHSTGETLCFWVCILHSHTSTQPPGHPPPPFTQGNMVEEAWHSNFPPF